MKRISLFLFVLFLGGLMTESCKKENSFEPSSASSTLTSDRISENGTNADETDITNARMNPGDTRSGYIYTMTNEAGANHILTFAITSYGTLSYKSSVETGGAGLGEGLGSQGSIVVSKDRNWLFAVNAGVNTVSSFRIGRDGILTLMDTKSSNGMLPVSLDVRGNVLYVLNRDSYNISGFWVNDVGMLNPIPNSSQTLSAAGTAGRQISFTTNGRFLYVTEMLADKISIFPVNGQGIASAGVSMSSVGMSPYGFAFARNHLMVVSNASGGTVNASTVTSYDGALQGRLRDVNGAIPNHQTAACWVATAVHGTLAYVTNTGSNSISTYYIGPRGDLSVAVAAIPTGSHPIDIVVSRDNLFVYNVNASTGSISEFRRDFGGELVKVGEIATTDGIGGGLATY